MKREKTVRTQENMRRTFGLLFFWFALFALTVPGVARVEDSVDATNSTTSLGGDSSPGTVEKNSNSEPVNAAKLSGEANTEEVQDIPGKPVLQESVAVTPITTADGAKHPAEPPGENEEKKTVVERPAIKKPEELPRSTRVHAGKAYVIEITGVINVISEEYFMRALDTAEADSANFVLVEMDTPGGLVESTRVMIKRMLTSKVPVVVYVTPQGSRAASAGTFLTMASHLAAMAPNTNIGSAHPIGIGGGGGGSDDDKDGDPKKRTKEQDAIMLEKMANDMAAWLGGIAENRGRNAEWAKEAILSSANIDCRTALEKNVIEYIALDRKELFEVMDGRAVKMGDGTHEIIETKGTKALNFPMTSREVILHLVSDPQIAYMLLMLGGMGIMFEVTHPGMVVPGMVGVIALSLAFMGFRILPVSGVGFLLLALAAAMFLLELSFPTGGILSVGAITSFAVGSYMLIEVPALKIPISLILTMTATMAFVFLVVLGYLVRSMRNTPVVSPGPLIGQVGRAEESFSEKGFVRVGGEYWKASLVGGRAVTAGDEVRVVRQEGAKLEVEPVE